MESLSVVLGSSGEEEEEGSSLSCWSAADVMIQRDMALDRLQALQKREGDYYYRGSSTTKTPTTTTPVPASPWQGRLRRRQSHPDGTHERQQGGRCGRPRRRADAAIVGSTELVNVAAAAGTADFARFRYRATFGKEWATMSSWAYEVVDYFHFPRGTVAWMMYYMDRVLSQRSSLDSDPDNDSGPAHNEFMLLSVTSLYLAMKLTCCSPSVPSSPTGSWGWSEVRVPRRLPLSALLELARNRFTSSQVSDTERHILRALQWRVHPPTPDQFVLDLVDVCCGPTTDRVDVYDCALYLVELSVVNHYFLDFQPSEIAVAAMMNAQNLTMRKVRQGDIESLDSGDDDAPCVILPAPIPAVFQIDPIHVLTGVDPFRVMWCRIRLTEMIDKQRQAQEQNNKENATTSPCGEATATRTSSPVSVVQPSDPANVPVVLGDAKPALGGVVELHGVKVEPKVLANLRRDGDSS